jgi:kynureninase
VAGDLPVPEADVRGHFLSFRLTDAEGVHARLRERGVVTDHRGDRLRVGLGLYHDAADIARLATALQESVTG